jgi:hypothetical protein
VFTSYEGLTFKGGSRATGDRAATNDVTLINEGTREERTVTDLKDFIENVKGEPLQPYQQELLDLLASIPKDKRPELMLGRRGKYFYRLVDKDGIKKE